MTGRTRGAQGAVAASAGSPDAASSAETPAAGADARMSAVGGPADFGVLLNLAGVVFVDALHQRLADAGFADFSVRSGWVLRTLGEDALSLRELAERIGLSSPGALKAIDPMLKAGYLERAEAADRRVRSVRVTERGRAALACAAAFHAEFEASLSAQVGPEDAAATRRGLEALVRRGSPHLPATLAPPH